MAKNTLYQEHSYKKIKLKTMMQVHLTCFSKIKMHPPPPELILAFNIGFKRQICLLQYLGHLKYPRLLFSKSRPTSVTLRTMSLLFFLLIY